MNLECTWVKSQSLLNNKKENANKDESIIVEEKGGFGRSFVVEE